jgi:hypothetical protein
LSNEILSNYFILDNDSWYTKFSQIGKEKIDPFIKNDVMIFQWKEITYKIDKENLNNADILNGYEWKGEIWFYAKLDRIAVPDKSNKLKWEDWKQSTRSKCFMEFEKYKGSWKVKKAVWTDSFLEFNLEKYFAKPKKEELPN